MPLTDETDPSDDEAPDPSVLRAERRLRVLEEMAEIGMEMLRALRDRTVGEAESTEEPGESPASKGPQKDPMDAFGKLSRAVRLTLALEAKFDEELRNLRAGLVSERKRRAEPKDLSKEELIASFIEEKRQVRDLVSDVIGAEAPDHETFAALQEALDERLEEDEAYVNLKDRPLREIIEQLCADLCLTPDWSLWTGEGWVEKPGGRMRCSRFHQPRPTPYWFDDVSLEERKRRLQLE